MSFDRRSIFILEKLLCNERLISHKQRERLLCENEEALVEYIKNGISNTQSETNRNSKS